MGSVATKLILKSSIVLLDYTGEEYASVQNFHYVIAAVVLALPSQSNTYTSRIHQASSQPAKVFLRPPTDTSDLTLE